MLMGWPAILTSLILSVLGILLRKAWMPVAGAVVCLGFAWYLTGTPVLIFKLTGCALPFCHLAAGAFVRRGHRWLGLLFLLPHTFVAGYLMAAVLSQ